MATRTSQRVGIWIIAVVMFVGTLGAFFLPILMNDNAAKESAERQRLIDESQKQLADSPCPPTTAVPAEKVSPPVLPETQTFDDIPELKTVDLTVGDGEEVKKGDCVELLYHGTLANNGKAFQGGSNYASGEPYRSSTDSFVPGFSQGLVGMRVGGERQIQIPSDLGYGAQESGEIPANADLVFTVRVIRIYKS